MSLGQLLGLSCLLLVGGGMSSPLQWGVSRTRQVELLVVVDAGLARALGGEVRPYVLALLGAADRLYRHPSLASDLRLAVSHVEVLWDEAQGPHVVSEAALALHEFCRWQRERRAQGAWNRTPYDAALLLTRQNLCQENFCESLGLGHIGTVCEADSGQNCAVVQDIGLQSAFTIAHEIGHLIGMAHDNSAICAQIGEFPQGNQIMSSMLSRIDFSEPWSRCSIRLSLGFFASGRGDCLLNEPSISLADSALLAGVTYERDIQCRLSFGPGHRARPMLDPCPILWCVARHQGEWHHASKQLPAADGTACGGGAICLSGKCTHNWKQKTPIDGSWGSWGPWGSCTRSCGGGVQYSRRRCDNPVPANLGVYCLGRWERFQSCSLETCVDPRGRTYRQEQCEERNNQSADGVLHEWEPYYHGIRWVDHCKLNCLEKSTAIVTVFSARVKDGTRCFPHSDAVCVRGQCIKTGCDGLIGSRKRYSLCGVCGGSNAQCYRVIRRFHGKVVNYTEVAVVPRGAASLKVQQQPRKGLGRFYTYLAVRREDGTYALNGGGHISTFKSLVQAGGVSLHYPGWSPRRDVLGTLTRAPLTENLHLQVYNPGRRRVVRVIYTYYLAGRMPERGAKVTGDPILENRIPILDPNLTPTLEPLTATSLDPRHDPNLRQDPDPRQYTHPTQDPNPRQYTHPTQDPNPKQYTRPIQDPNPRQYTRPTQDSDPTQDPRLTFTSVSIGNPTPDPTIDSRPVTTLTPSNPSPTPDPQPSWQTGLWQFCSVSCGVGWVVRWVGCVDRAGRPAGGCAKEQQPRSMALCVRGFCRKGGD